MNKKKKLDQNTIQTAKRLLKYMTGTHKIQFIIVFICIFISSAASIAVSLSLKFLLDDFIIPLIGQTDPNFAELYKALAVLGCIFALGVIATFIYTRMMVYIGQCISNSRMVRWKDKKLDCKDQGTYENFKSVMGAGYAGISGEGL